MDKESNNNSSSSTNDSKTNDGQKEVMLETNKQVYDPIKTWSWDYLFLVGAFLCSIMILIFIYMKKVHAAFAMISLSLGLIVVFGFINS